MLTLCISGGCGRIGCCGCGRFEVEVEVEVGSDARALAGSSRWLEEETKIDDDDDDDAVGDSTELVVVMVAAVVGIGNEYVMLTIDVSGSCRRINWWTCVSMRT